MFREVKKAFTLIELLIAVVILAIVSKLAYGAFSDIIRRSKMTTAFAIAASYADLMERYYTTNNKYGSRACGGTLPASVEDFSFSCVLGTGGQTFVATATGSGPVDGYVYTIDQMGAKKTTKFNGVALSDPVPTCWRQEQGQC